MSFSFFEQITRKVRDDMVTSILNYHSLDWVTEAWDNTHKYVKKFNFSKPSGSQKFVYK